MKITIETMEEFDALPPHHSKRLLEIIQFAVMINGADLEEHPDFPGICMGMLQRIEHHPETAELSQYIMGPELETTLRVRMLKEYATGFMQ